MDKLKFKNYTWPNNPDHYRQSYEREPQYTTTPEGLDAFIGMGSKRLTITGSGVFSGDTAYGSFQALAEVFAQPEAGELVHPIWGKKTVYFTALEMTQEPRVNYVEYRFEFREADVNGIIPK